MTVARPAAAGLPTEGASGVTSQELAELPELAHAGHWLGEARVAIGADVNAIATQFPSVGRHCGRGPVTHLPGWTVDDAARALLLLAVPAEQRAAQAAELYRYGDAAERRAVLRALSVSDLDIGAAAVPLVHDAIRTNDTRLVAAALGPYAAAHLDDASWRQAVLKCLFVGVPLTVIAGLADRNDAALAGMLADFTLERVAAGRDVPLDVWPLLAKHAKPAEALVTTLGGELASTVPGRREAANKALSAFEEYR